MALTDTAIKRAKPRAKPYKLGDTLGLFLLVQPSGGKLWRLKYRMSGKEKKLGLGTYPEVSLAKARERRDAARIELADGKDPSIEKQRREAKAATEATNTFATIAEEFVERWKRDGQKPWAPATIAKADFLLAQLNPDLGALPVTDIEPSDILRSVRKIEQRGNHETAKRSLQMAGRVFRYAVATARLASDPTRDLRGALSSAPTRHHAAILDPVKVGELLRVIDGYQGYAYTRIALALAPHLFVRPGELRQACWEEVDFDQAVWTIPVEKMKMRRPHHVPLSDQALALFKQAKVLTSRTTGYVFPSIRTSARPMSENTLNAALRRLGYTGDEMTSHGFRSIASTLLNESGKWSPDAIERALAHGDSNKVRAVYHRGEHWQERVAMAHWWSDYLDQLRDGGEIVPLVARK